MITGDHKLLSEEEESRLRNQEEESRLRHTCAVVVQVDATLIVSKLSMQNQISSRGDEMSLNILTPRRKSEIHLYGQFSGMY